MFVEELSIPTDTERAIETIAWLEEALSIKDISDATGLSQSTLRRMRSGKATQRTWDMLDDLIREQASMQDYGLMY